MCKLKTQNSFIQSVRKQELRLCMDISCPLESELKFTNPLDCFNLKINLCLGQGTVKQDTPTAVLYTVAMKIIDILYSEPN